MGEKYKAPKIKIKKVDTSGMGVKGKPSAGPLEMDKAVGDTKKAPVSQYIKLKPGVDPTPSYGKGITEKERLKSRKRESSVLKRLFGD